MHLLQEKLSSRQLIYLFQHFIASYLGLRLRLRPRGYFMIIFQVDTHLAAPQAPRTSIHPRILLDIDCLDNYWHKN